MRRLPEILLQAVILSGLLVCSGQSGRAADLYQLILDGRISEARDSLSRQVSAATRNGDQLFFQSLLAQRGAESERLMRAALKAAVSERYQEEIYFRLAQYYVLENDLPQLSTTVDTYMSRWQEGSYRAEMVRLALLSEELSKRRESAMRLCDQYLVTYTSREAQQKGLIDKARLMIADGKGIGSSRTLTGLSREKSGQGIPQALYLLGRDAAERNKLDDAVLYYNLLREAYPRAVGLDDLVEALGRIEAAPQAQKKSTKPAGAYYAVKVGVFANADNAKRFAELFKQYKKPVEVVAKEISGKSYRVIYVGRFQEYDEAVRFKLQLEAARGEEYQVVSP